MNHENPTSLRIGQHGRLGGKDFCILGRVVMGVTIAGETYFWQEFNLQAADDTSAILVYEESEDEWRLFTEFEPEFPMSAAEAAAKQVGAPLNLNGENVRVTLIQTSRVYRIEGKPPDDSLRVGSVASYFNAEANGIMQVVSWTRDQVEYYNGLNLTGDTVAKAFDMPSASARIHRHFGNNLASRHDNRKTVWTFVFYTVVATLFLGVIFHAPLSSYMSAQEAKPAGKTPPSGLPLALDSKIKCQGSNYQVTAHAIVEIDLVGSIYECHEYTVAGDDGQLRLLVCGDAAGARHWTLYQPLSPPIMPTAVQAAAQKIGDIVNIDGIVGTVGELFQSTVTSVEAVKATDWNKGDVRFNYLAYSHDQSLLVSWNYSQINAYRGVAVLPQDLRAVPASH